MSDTAITFLASLPYPHTAMRVLGDGGYIIYLNVPEDEMGAVMQLMLMRQSVIKITAEDVGARPVKAKRGRKKNEPEWGDDGDSDSDTR